MKQNFVYNWSKLPTLLIEIHKLNEIINNRISWKFQ